MTKEYVRKKEKERNKEKTIDDRKKRSRQEIEKELERKTNKKKTNKKKTNKKKTNKKEQYEVYIMERQRSKSLCDERI